MTVAALYVATRGCYYDLEGVEPWGLPDRDARLYAGPWPVVAHPPCKRWGRYWFGGPSAKVRRVKGDDGGCFAAALASVRSWGGVLEHPEASAAWAEHGIMTPPRGGGWISAGMDDPGWTCCVEQGHYGHRARKATWLYAVGCDLPLLHWGSCGRRARLDPGYHSAEERAFRAHRPLSPEMARRKSEWMTAVELATGTKDFRRLTAREAAATPPAFRDALLAIASSARPAIV